MLLVTGFFYQNLNANAFTLRSGIFFHHLTNSTSVCQVPGDKIGKGVLNVRKPVTCLQGAPSSHLIHLLSPQGVGPCELPQADWPAARPRLLTEWQLRLSRHLACLAHCCIGEYVFIG